jgi:hypothetical protein
MRRLILLSYAFFVLISGAASAWASCKQIPFASADDHRSSPLAQTHDDGADYHVNSDQKDSHHTATHYCTLKQFLPSAAVLFKPDRGEKPVSDLFETEFASLLDHPGCERLVHGPPAVVRSSSISFHLFLVLRI